LDGIIREYRESSLMFSRDSRDSRIAFPARSGRAQNTRLTDNRLVTNTGILEGFGRQTRSCTCETRPCAACRHRI